MQAYLIDDLRGKNWRKRGSVAIRVPQQNDLRDIAALRKAVQAANEFMAALYPPSIKKSIKAQQLRLESLDPRFSIQIDVIQGQEHVTVLAKEQVEGTIAFKGEPEAVAHKMESLFGRGLPTSFCPGEIEATGSPLFAEAFK